MGVRCDDGLGENRVDHVSAGVRLAMYTSMKLDRRTNTTLHTRTHGQCIATCV